MRVLVFVGVAARGEEHEHCDGNVATGTRIRHPQGMRSSMMMTVIEGVLWVLAMLILWQGPPSWKPVAYVLIGAAVLVAVIAYLASVRRTKEAQVRVDTAKRELDELRKKS
jgi:hypothetical protein